MIATISSSHVSGNILAPASKSAMQRACALALLNNGTTLISNPGKSNDDLAALDIISRCGAVVQKTVNDNLSIDSSGNIRASGIIHCGESGLSLRMFTSILALSNEEIILEGEGSLLKRPVHFFDTVLPQLGVKTNTHNGFLPLSITGTLIPKNICVDGSMSSQYLTGLLFAFAKAAKERVTITVNNLTSKPYIDLSLQMMRMFGYNVINNDYKTFIVHPAEHKTRNVLYETEGDWSGAAFLLVAGVIAGKSVKVYGLSLNSMQADKEILHVLHLCGADISFSDDHICVSAVHPLKAFTFDATDSPDLFPPLVALATYCNGTSVIKGTSRLLTKESNRLVSLHDVFTKMGVQIIAEGDTLSVSGGNIIKGAEVESHHDHRIVMACAVAGLRCTGKVIITGAEAIDKSYPDFFRHLIKLGADITLSS